MFIFHIHNNILSVSGTYFTCFKTNSLTFIYVVFCIYIICSLGKNFVENKQLYTVEDTSNRFIIYCLINGEGHEGQIKYLLTLYDFIIFILKYILYLLLEKIFAFLHYFTPTSSCLNCIYHLFIVAQQQGTYNASEM